MYLTQNYPEVSPEPVRPDIAEQINQVDENTLVTPQELLEPAVGEDLDDQVEQCQDESLEPTEKQKREILKIHRGVGHPSPQDFGRALKNAGMSRHLIRWAMRDMRCPVCESRVKPKARPPSTLPRCLRFNQTIGIDLFEYLDTNHRKLIMNIVCWGTGYQMCGMVADKTAIEARNCLAELWVKHWRTTTCGH